MFLFEGNKSYFKKKIILYQRLKISNCNNFILVLIAFFSVTLINLPTYNSMELTNQELYSDFENEQNNNEVDNELDDQINISMLTFSSQTQLNLNSNFSNNDYQILFLEIDSPPPDLI